MNSLSFFLVTLVLILGYAISTTTAVAAAEPEPIQFRIALIPNGMTVSWSTVNPISSLPKVIYGTSSIQLNQNATGYTLHYEPSITWFHHVVLENLSPSTTYYWQVISDDSNVLQNQKKKIENPILKFRTAPPVGADMPFRFAVYGDFGDGNSAGTLKTLRKIKDEFDLFYHIGDLAYADDYDRLNSTYEQVQELWMNDMSDIWENTPYMYTPGNHEASCNHDNDCPVGQLNFTSYRYRYRMPNQESGSPSSLFYSFDYGLVHFVSIDTEVDFPNSPEGPGTKKNCGPFGDQLTWLRNDLEKAVTNRHNVPWIFVGGHRPYYSAHKKDEYPAAYENDTRAAFEDILNKYQVDIVFWGHIHNTQRMWPIAPGGVVAQESYVNAPNPIYIITASVGNVEGLGKIDKDEKYGYVAWANGDKYGIGMVDVYNATTLRWSMVESETLEVLDEAFISKDPITKPIVVADA
jgi:predicted phosphodiesterase